MNRVIFLDVDDVLNSQTFAEKMFSSEGISVFNENILCSHSLYLLKRLVEQTGAGLVLSSSWRKIPRCRRALEEQLLRYGLSIEDETRSLAGERGDEISDWLSRHPEVKSYVILDDDSDMGIHLPRLVKTKFKYGLQAKHCERAKDILLSNSC